MEQADTRHGPRTLYTGPVYVHTHTSTFAHSKRQQHVGRVQITCPYKAGMGPMPGAEANIAHFCDDLHAQMAATTRTLCAVQQRAQDSLAQRHLDMVSAGETSVAQQRTQANACLDSQMQLQLDIMDRWLRDPARGVCLPT